MRTIRLKRCFLRFEPNIGDGTMFLFNKENGEMLEGDYYSYVIINTLKNGENLDLLSDRIAFENDRDISEVKEEIRGILDVLFLKGFIEYE